MNMDFNFLYVNDMAKGSLFEHNLDYKIFTKHIKPMLSDITFNICLNLKIIELADRGQTCF